MSTHRPSKHEFTLPSDNYQRDLALGHIEDDPAQRHALGAFDSLALALHTGSWLRRPQGLWARLAARLRLDRKKPPQGLYVWGSVGRGKTYLMDLFVESMASPQVLRTHFHQFMADVHQLLQQFQEIANPLDEVASHFAGRFRIICLDEFFVKDIGDAMILANLLKALFARDMVLLTTSNIPPPELYKDGLQRERFLAAIVLLKAHTKVLNLDARCDYRSLALAGTHRYLLISDDDKKSHAQSEFRKIFEDYDTTEREQSGASKSDDRQLSVQGRTILVERKGHRVLWASFQALCEGPRSQRDYLEIATRFSLILLDAVPVMTSVQDNEARRFIYLVDVLYENRCRLVIAAEVLPQELYQGERLAFEYQRTLSRLHEMQSDAYFLNQQTEAEAIA